jgi:hypothetical protein
MFRGGGGRGNIGAGGSRTTVGGAYSSNFQGFLDDWVASGGNVKSLGGFNYRNIAGTNTLSEHAKEGGRAIDINQIGRNVVTGGLPGGIAAEEALARKWGLRPGSSFRNPDRGHFEIAPGVGAEAARAIAERNRIDQSLRGQLNPAGESSAKITVDVNAPKGTRVGAEADGLFRDVQINRATQMTPAAQGPLESFGKSGGP